MIEDHDLPLMPTQPLKATPIPKPDVPRLEIIQRAFEMLPNTAPFDVTGHPSMSAPCGLSDGLPAGMMLTAKHSDEVAIYRAATAFEKAGDWRGITQYAASGSLSEAAGSSVATAGSVRF